MYIIFGDQIVDSEEIKVEIEENSDFKVEKDMCKATKREDVLAYQLSISIDTLNDYLKEEYDLEGVELEDLFEEYMNVSEEEATDLEDIMPEYSLMNVRSYKLDISENVIKTIITISHRDLGELKLSDVTKRLLSETD